jgi:serine/threonine protein kinase/tetratricopeptide (TPR) repeat protein
MAPRPAWNIDAGVCERVRFEQMLASMEELPIATTFGGVYEVIQPLGAGAQGRVYKAKHLGFDKIVALKVLRSDLPGDDILRFKQEAYILSRLSNPGIPGVLGLGLVDDRIPFMAMEFIEGIPLSAIMADTAAQPTASRALQWLVQIAQTLSYIHSNGIIHRDVKPANILIVPGSEDHDTAKLVDFGMIKVTTTEFPDQHLTRTGMVLGTPGYMSPEQLCGQLPNKWSDMYSFGILAAELLMRDGNLPAALVPVISKCLQHAPEDRYRDMSEVAAELVAVNAQSLSKEVPLHSLDLVSGRRRLPNSWVTVGLLGVALVGIIALAMAVSSAFVSGLKDRLSSEPSHGDLSAATVVAKTFANCGMSNDSLPIYQALLTDQLRSRNELRTASSTISAIVTCQKNFKNSIIYLTPALSNFFKLCESAKVTDDSLLASTADSLIPLVPNSELIDSPKQLNPVLHACHFRGLVKTEAALAKLDMAICEHGAAGSNENFSKLLDGRWATYEAERLYIPALMVAQRSLTLKGIGDAPEPSGRARAIAEILEGLALNDKQKVRESVLYARALMPLFRSSCGQSNPDLLRLVEATANRAFDIEEPCLDLFQSIDGKGELSTRSLAQYACCYRMNHQPRKDIEVFQRFGHRIKPSEPTYTLMALEKAICYNDLGQYSDTIKAATDGVRMGPTLHPWTEKLLLEKSKALLKLGRAQEAIRIDEQLVSCKDPDELGVYKKEARSLLAQTHR